MSTTLFRAGQAFTRAYKKFDDFAEKGVIGKLKERFTKKPTLSKSKELVVFDSKKSLPAKTKLPKPKTKLGRLKTVGRVLSRGAVPLTLGIEGANIAYKIATRTPEQKARAKALKTKLKKTSTKDYHSDLLKMSTGGDTMLKKIPEGPKGEGLRKLKAKRPDVTKKMGFAKKGKMLKASYGTMAKGNVSKALQKEKVKKAEKEETRRTLIKKLRGAQVGPAEEAKVENMTQMEMNKKLASLAAKSAIKKRIGGMSYANVGMAAKKVREKEMMKASEGKSVRGYGAARTSGMGLQDEQLAPGKSLDYYKDLM